MKRPIVHAALGLALASVGTPASARDRLDHTVLKRRRLRGGVAKAVNMTALGR